MNGCPAKVGAKVGRSLGGSRTRGLHCETTGISSADLVRMVSVGFWTTNLFTSKIESFWIHAQVKQGLNHLNPSKLYVM